MRDSVREIMDAIQQDMESLGCKPTELYIILDDDGTWLELLQRTAAPDVNIKTLTNKEEFKTILRENGKLKLVIDVRMPGVSGIDLAEEMGLKDRAHQLMFVSSSPLLDDELDRIAIDHFLDTLAEIAMAIIRRRQQLDQ